jgi:putative two-component system response regulator
MAHRENILVVDDEQAVQRLITLLLRNEGFGCATAGSATEARERLADQKYDVMLCDVTMPGESGLELVRDVMASQRELAVVMVTGVDDPELARAALDLGAYGYVVKPFAPNTLLIAVANALHRRRLELENRRHREQLEELVFERTMELREAITRLQSSEAALQRSREEAIRRLAMAVEFRDGETGEHIERMSDLCGLVARRLGLPADQCELIRLASPLHDIGKIAIPDRILLNPDPLDSDQWEVMRGHAELGYRMLAGSDEELLELAATIAWTHHERIDGSGYPRGLRGDEIPIEGRIAAVADVYDALTSGRVYQEALPQDEAIEILESGRGTLFDSAVLEAFLAELNGDTKLGARPRSPQRVSE